MQPNHPFSTSPFGPDYSAQRYANERAIMANWRPQGAQLEAWRQSIKAQAVQHVTGIRSGG